jgi:hypothetical protein
MSVLNYKKENLSISDLENLEDNYGVKISSTHNGKIKIDGKYNKDIEEVSNILKKTIFLQKNKNSVPKFKSKKGSMSSNLLNYDSDNNNKNKNNKNERIFIMY